MPVAATVTTPLQLAGVDVLALVFSLPAATMTTAPRARAVSIAACVVLSQAPVPPRDRLSTRAGVAFAGMPLTLAPEAHRMPSAMSEV
jgi:hypothetical protein